VLWHVVDTPAGASYASVWLSPNSLGVLEGGPFPDDNDHAMQVADGLSIDDAKQLQQKLVKFFGEISVMANSELVTDD
jgi:hypothetical protein